ncbi:protein of unknown function [Kyrpidia spormannii]|uniref:Uncharacterized protein n=2 Tax=Kyrpidia spormannii TaxID=2055160 RepID=A0ACA8ZCQ5_9BACL|nr:protein of unknown function [Kyrpidia spormannii]
MKSIQHLFIVLLLWTLIPTVLALVLMF